VARNACAQLRVADQQQVAARLDFLEGDVGLAVGPDLARLVVGQQRLPGGPVEQHSVLRVGDGALTVVVNACPETRDGIEVLHVLRHVLVQPPQVLPAAQGLLALVVPVADLQGDEHAGNDDQQLDDHREPVMLPDAKCKCPEHHHASRP